MAMLLATSNIPFTFVDVFNKSVKNMFPDSDIAHQYANGRTKATQIVKGECNVYKIILFSKS